MNTFVTYFGFIYLTVFAHVLHARNTIEITDYYNGMYNTQSGDTVNEEHMDVDIPIYEKMLEYQSIGATCGLCIIVDEEFAKVYNIKDDTSLRVTVDAIVDQASWIFRSTDWDNDGRSDNVGFKMISLSFGWKPFKYETVAEYDTPKMGLKLLKLFARQNFDKCCLGVGFTNRPFLHGLDGIAFGASDKILGGICDHRNPKEESMVNMNAVLISSRGRNGTQLSPPQITRALVHSLGHAFGVHAHDNEYTDPLCWGFRPTETSATRLDTPQDGRYLMWTDYSKEEGMGKLKFPIPPKNDLPRKNSLQFSRCSKFSVAIIIAKRKRLQNCFEFSSEPYCGNGIVEGLELCDCGGLFDCMAQSCCGARQSERPCSVVNVKGCPTDTVLKISDHARAGYTQKSGAKKCSLTKLVFLILGATPILISM